MVDQNDSAEIILFFQGKTVLKEMMFAEFEAILDGVVGLEDLADNSMSAVYVIVNLQLVPTSICLFTIEFDALGEAPKDWNIPFRSLVSNCAAGPDLGAGPIQLAIRSQCPTGWYADHLWDPEPDTLELIAQAVKRNRLCLPYEPQSKSDQRPPPPAYDQNPGAGYQQYANPQGYYPPQNPAQNFGQPMPDPRMMGGWQMPGAPNQPMLGQPGQPGYPPQVAPYPPQENYDQAHQHEIPELNEALGEVKSSSEMESLIHEVEEQHKERLIEVQAKQKQQIKKVHDQAHKLISKYKRLISDEKNLNTEIQNQVSMQSAQIDLLKEQNSDQKKRIEELMLKIEAQEGQVSKEEVIETEKNLQAAQETIKLLREELTLLRRDSRRLAENGTNDFFEKLEDSGLSFIAFHPGAGHVSVSIESMAEYLENPKVFAARKCNIPLEDYQVWLEHYEKPECLAQLGDNKVCGVAVKRVNHPNDFKAGASDRCDKHRTGFSASSSVRNYGFSKK